MCQDNNQLQEKSVFNTRLVSTVESRLKVPEDLEAALQLLEMRYQPALSLKDQMCVYTNSWADKKDKIGTSVAIVTDENVELICKHKKVSKQKSFDYRKPESLANMIMFVEKFYNKYDYILSFDYILVGKDVITAARSKSSNRINEKERIQSLLVRCKSSNIWSYGIDIKDRKSGVGDMYIQFKGKNGGPDGGLYKYYDVPVSVYRRFIASSSKGHAFWTLLRDQYSYSKLTGDKRGKLPNAIN